MRLTTTFCGILFLYVGVLHAETNHFQAPTKLKAAGEDILVGGRGHSAPTIVDINKDGLADLVVGLYKSKREDGNFLVYLNKGTNKIPEYEKGYLLKSADKLIAIPDG